MKKKFRYDYNYKMLIIYSFISTIFLILFVASYEKSLIVFCIFGIAFLICLFYSFIINKYLSFPVKSFSIDILDFGKYFFCNTY